MLVPGGSCSALLSAPRRCKRRSRASGPSVCRVLERGISLPGRPFDIVPWGKFEIEFFRQTSERCREKCVGPLACQVTGASSCCCGRLLDSQVSAQAERPKPVGVYLVSPK